MIKQSLSELRERLENMKRNKIDVESGIKGYETRNDFN
jgi:hypothetical protein